MAANRYPDPLAVKFAKFGFSYNQVHRTPNAAVYEVQSVDGGAVAYEVVKPVVSKQRFMNGSWSECSPYETYPSSELWGKRGWTFVDKEKAIAKCEEV